ncbi:MAG: hypothetical protein ACTSPJ_07700 [Candidatus Heimdallarchaeaceae archaeon]
MKMERKRSGIKVLFTEQRYKIWISLLYFMFVSLILITIGTIVQSGYVLSHLDTVDQEIKDPAIYWFPYLIYVPYTLFILPLILSIINNLKMNNIEKYSFFKDSNKIIHKFSRKVNWKKKLNTYPRIVRKLSLILLFFFSSLFYLVAIFAPSLAISPINGFYQPFILSFLMLWIAMGLKKENRNIILWFFLFLILAMALFTTGIIIAEDFIILPYILGYQAFALFLMIINYLLLSKERE